MERRSDPVTPPRPPALAEWLLARLTSPHVRSALLGDLAEEFAQRSNQSPKRARGWYWHQLIRSFPHLIISRARATDALARCLSLSIMTAVIVFLVAWDLMISRPSAYWVAMQEQPPTLLIVRIIYFAVQTLGALLGGAVIALTLFNPQRPFWRNATLYLGPVIIALIVLSCLAALERGLVRSTSYLLLRNGLSLVALLSAAALTSTFTSRRS